MKTRIVILIISLMCGLSCFSQISINYSYNFFLNSEYNLKEFDESKTFRYKKNHNFNLEFEFGKNEKNKMRVGLVYQYMYGETNPKIDSAFVSPPGNYNIYELTKKRNINIIGCSIGFEHIIIPSGKIRIGLNGILGWSIINKKNDYSPDGSYPWDENVLSQGPLFGISFISKFNVLTCKYSDVYLKVFVNERIIELNEGNFTVGLGIEFNLLK